MHLSNIPTPLELDNIFYNKNGKKTPKLQMGTPTLIDTITQQLPSIRNLDSVSSSVMFTSLGVPDLKSLLLKSSHRLSSTIQNNSLINLLLDILNCSFMCGSSHH